MVSAGCFFKARLIPRPRGRGLIEAEPAGSNPKSTAAIPRPRGRGLIEAFCTSRRRRARCKFHDRAVVASLKRLIFMCDLADRFRIPRPRGRGLIEAEANRSVA